jgi:3-methyladenine DNA glycosylase AlkD
MKKPAKEKPAERNSVKKQPVATQSIKQQSSKSQHRAATSRVATTRTKSAAAVAKSSPSAVIAKLKVLADARTLNGMARYAIPSDNAFGVPMRAIQELGKRLGPNHELAVQLWKSGWYEARTLAAFVAEPERLTPAQMDRWARDFDSWAICDTVCFKLFDRTPHAFDKVEQWARREEEFIKRAAFALLATLALHGAGSDAQLTNCLPLIERAVSDERNFVKKGVSWALRAMGRRGAGLNAAALQLARKLAASSEPTARWIGKDAVRDLTKPKQPRARSHVPAVTDGTARAHHF